MNRIQRILEIFTADVKGLFPSIPHDSGLEVLWTRYNKFKNKVVLTEDFLNLDALHERLNSHYEARSYKKKTRLKKHTGNLFRKNLQLKDVC